MTKLENSSYKTYHSVTKVSSVTSKSSQIATFLVVKIARNGRFQEKNKIWTRLAQRPTLVVLCLKLWLIRGGGTVRVTKCVILASIWASNCLLGKATKQPVKGLERGLYGQKINGNLIKYYLQVCCDNPGGFQKIGPGAENRVLYSSRKSPETDICRKK
jgi:hypothetical protein